MSESRLVSERLPVEAVHAKETTSAALGRSKEAFGVQQMYRKFSIMWAVGSVNHTCHATTSQ